MAIDKTEEGKVLNFYKGYDESSRLTQDSRHLVELLRKQFLYDKLMKEVKGYSPKILQISCGTGVLTKHLAEKYPKAEIYAFDLVEKHIEFAKSELGGYPNVKLSAFNCLDMSALREFTGGIKFDVILIEGAWYHLTGAARASLLKILINNYVKSSTRMVIDWLSNSHAIQQFIFKNKDFPKVNIRGKLLDENGFYYDDATDLESLSVTLRSLTKEVGLTSYVHLYPVDRETRFAFRELNSMSLDAVETLISWLNSGTFLYGVKGTYLMEATEHGCYVVEFGLRGGKVGV